MLQFGLFNDDQDEDPRKVKGTLKFEDAQSIQMQATVTQYAAASTLMSGLTALFLGLYCVMY